MLRYLILCLFLPAALCLAPFTAMAEPSDYAHTVTGSTGATTDYRHRGISLSDEGLSANAHAQINHPAGPYGGLKGATVDLNADSDADVEAILFGGMQGKYDGIDYDARLSYSVYPGADDDLDYWEFMLSGGYDFDVFYAALTWAFSPNYINDSGITLSYGADLSVPFMIGSYELDAKGHLGFSFIEDENNFAEDYADWSLGLWYNWREYDVDFGLEYVDTDLSSHECVEECGARGVLSVKKDFGW